MSIIPNQTPIEYNGDEKLDIILTNTIKMLYNRGIIDDEHTILSSVMEQKNDENQYNIDTKVGKYVVKILPQKITTKSKSSNIYEFLMENKKNHTIVVVLQITNKLISDLQSEFKDTEIFREFDLMTDKVSYCFVPKHELLSDEDGKKCMDEYKIKKREMAKINAQDPIAKYYNAKSGQIFKIIRASPISAVEITYRVVK